MTAGLANSDLGHIHTGNEVPWSAECRAQGCAWYLSPLYARKKAAVIRSARQHAAVSGHKVELHATIWQVVRPPSGA